MKELNKFHEENKMQVNPIEKTNQSSHKGGRFLSKSGLSGFYIPTPKSVSKIEKWTQPKIFTSFTELRSYLSGGK